MADISDLESQYELESNEDSEFEYGEDAELDDDSELDDEFELGDEPEGELDQSQSYAERFHELAMREFETDEELEVGLRDILGEMEQQYFLGGLMKKGLGFAKKFAGKAVKAGVGMAARHLKKLPIAGVLKSATGLLGKNLTDTLMRLAQSAIPGGAIGIPALQALGIIPGGASADANSGSEGKTWERFAEFAQEVYETAADQVNPNTLNPMSSMLQANKAIQQVVAQNYSGRSSPGRTAMSPGGQRRRIVRVRPGESVLVVCK